MLTNIYILLQQCGQNLAANSSFKQLTLFAADEPIIDPVVSLKRPTSVDYKLCIFCQSHKNDISLREATDHGLSQYIVKSASCTRRKLRDTKNINVIDIIESSLNFATSIKVLWHKMCYAHFTDKSKIERLQKAQAEQSTDEAS